MLAQPCCAWRVQMLLVHRQRDAVSQHRMLLCNMGGVYTHHLRIRGATAAAGCQYLASLRQTQSDQLADARIACTACTAGAWPQAIGSADAAQRLCNILVQDDVVRHLSYDVHPHIMCVHATMWQCSTGMAEPCHRQAEPV